MENNQAQNQNQKEDEKKRRWLLLLLLLLLLLFLGIGTWAMMRTKTPPPDYPQQEVDGNSEPIGDGDGDATKLETPEGGGAVSLTYSKEVSISLSEKKASLMFANPSRSTQNITLQLVIGDTVILQTGTLTPGNQVTSLMLEKDAESGLAAGSCEGTFVVSFYDPQSGEKAMLSTEIPVTVTIAD